MAVPSFVLSGAPESTCQACRDCGGAIPSA